MKILGISGYAGHGKNYLASHLQAKFGGQIIHLADSLKSLCSTVFNIPLNLFYDSTLKNKPFSALKLSNIHIDEYLLKLSYHTKLAIIRRGLIACSPRELLQFVGTEYVRSVQNTFWETQLVQTILNNKHVPYWYVPDVRFLDEWLYLKKHFGDNFQLIQVFRPDISFNTTHASERPDLLRPVLKGFFKMRTNDHSQLDEIAYLIMEQFLAS